MHFRTGQFSLQMSKTFQILNHKFHHVMNSIIEECTVIILTWQEIFWLQITASLLFMWIHYTNRLAQTCTFRQSTNLGCVVPFFGEVAYLHHKPAGKIPHLVIHVKDKSKMIKSSLTRQGVTSKHKSWINHGHIPIPNINHCDTLSWVEDQTIIDSKLLTYVKHPLYTTNRGRH